MSKLISLKIDGVDVAVPDGTTIFDAAKSVGIDIPHICYDPNLGLPPSSSCRLCVVEVEGAKTLVASCSHPVSEGMVVRTDSDLLRETRRMVLELLLSDHPSDCLSCEKCAQCSLQDYAYRFGVRESGYQGKRVTPQPVLDGPAIVYDPA
ncbi:MAG: 2Fe-2S iron-sulfur cluster-binding protein, partial [Armatimonadetes bacterium]|nr:2Fe-2S iron-sulfur cluster-binding protein [Armatimonadota bacterium]